MRRYLLAPPGWQKRIMRRENISFLSGSWPTTELEWPKCYRLRTDGRMDRDKCQLKYHIRWKYCISFIKNHNLHCFGLSSWKRRNRHYLTECVDLHSKNIWKVTYILTGCVDYFQEGRDIFPITKWHAAPDRTLNYINHFRVLH